MNKLIYQNRTLKAITNMASEEGVAVIKELESPLGPAMAPSREPDCIREILANPHKKMCTEQAEAAAAADRTPTRHCGISCIDFTHA